MTLTTKFKIALQALLLIIFNTHVVSPANAEELNSFVLHNVQIFDGKVALEGKSIVVEDGLIKAVTDDAGAWQALSQIDGQGGTVMPGLMDAHTHTQTLFQLEETLRFGVTTIFDMATAPAAADMLREAARTRDDVADYRSAVFLATMPKGHGTQYGREVPTLSTPDEADAFVQARVDEGADYLKIIVSGSRAEQGWPILDADTIHALIDAAHAHDLLAVAHIETPDDVRTVLGGGIDGIVHVWRTDGAVPDISAQLAESGVFVVTTLVTQDGFIDGAGGATLVADARLRPYMSDKVVEELTTKGRGPTLTDIDRFIEAVGGLIEAGVTILTGTDVSAGTTFHGVSVHRELELLVSAGLSPSEALAAATSNVANAYGLSDRGVIAAGKRADLLLVRGDPTKDVTASRDIISVWRGGVELDRELM
jgi:imidazolonepropionase-like amidohydrolase